MRWYGYSIVYSDTGISQRLDVVFCVWRALRCADGSRAPPRFSGPNCRVRLFNYRVCRSPHPPPHSFHWLPRRPIHLALLYTSNKCEYIHASLRVARCILYRSSGTREFNIQTKLRESEISIIIVLYIYSWQYVCLQKQRKISIFVKP